MININKCKAWIDISIALIKMSKELTNEEADYIKAQLMIIQGNLKIEELRNKGEQIQK